MQYYLSYLNSFLCYLLWYLNPYKLYTLLFGAPRTSYVELTTRAVINGFGFVSQALGDAHALVVEAYGWMRSTVGSLWYDGLICPYRFATEDMCSYRAGISRLIWTDPCAAYADARCWYTAEIVGIVIFVLWFTRFLARFFQWKTPVSWLSLAFVGYGLSLMWECCILGAQNCYPFGFRLMPSWRFCRVDDLSKVMRAGLPEPKLKVQPDHPHGWLAAHRAFWHGWIMKTIRNSGRDVYEVSFSHRSNTRGYHMHYTSRDQAWPVRADKLSGKDVLVMIDVDHYLDMNEWMGFGLPIFIYSMYPRNLRVVHPECVASMREDQLEVSVKGGGSYLHKLWDYQRDYVSNGVNIFRVDRVRVSDFHQLVLLSPFAWNFFAGDRIARHAGLTFNGVNVRRVVKGDAEMVELNGDNATASIPASTYETIINRAHSGTKIYQGDVDAALRRVGVDSLVGASLLYKIILEGPPRKAGSVTYVTNTETQAPGKLDKPRCHDVLPPLDKLEPYVPAKGQDNATASVKLRLEEIRNTVIPSSEYAGYAREFVSFFPEASVVPCSMEYVLTEQSRPIQRKRNRAALDSFVDDKCKVKAFVKAESYNEDKDPRNISNVATNYQLELSRYTLAVKSDILKGIHWYSPGQTADEIAKSVHWFVSNLGKVAETDFSRFDGTISEWLRRNVEFAVYRQVLAPEAWRKFIKLAVQELTSPATAGSYDYDVGGSRLSGSPLTTDGNTIIGAYVDFVGNRLMGLSPRESWFAIGLHFGDDGISRVNGSEEAARHLGLTLKLRVVQPGERLSYLGRLYPDPWASPGSLQEPARVWYKINATVQSKGIPELRGKWDAYLRSDHSVPVLAAYCRAMLRNSEGEISEDTGYVFSVTGTGWPQSEQSAEVEREYLGVERPDELIEVLNKCASMEQAILAMNRYCVLPDPTPPTSNNTRVALVPEELRCPQNANEIEQYKSAETAPAGATTSEETVPSEGKQQPPTRPSRAKAKPGRSRR